MARERGRGARGGRARLPCSLLSRLPRPVSRPLPYVLSSPAASSAPRARPQIVGLLGGIASGKSLAAHWLAGPSGLVVSADALAHEALADPELAPRLRAAFGASALRADGQPDRAAIARAAFAEPALRRQLEGWIHPAVRVKIAAALHSAELERRPRVVLDVPLLLENDAEHGLARSCDVLVCIDSDPAARDARAVASRGWSPGEVARREAAQLPQEAKRARCHYHIDNRGDLEEFRARCEALRRELDRLPPRASHPATPPPLE